MKIIQENKILKTILLAFILSVAFSSAKSEATEDCEENKSSIFCKQSARQQAQWMNWEVSNNLTNFKQDKIINKKSPVIVSSYKSARNQYLLDKTNKPFVNNTNKKIETVKSTRPKSINRSYQYAILALDKRGQSDLRQCVKAVDKDKYKKKMSGNTIKVKTALNLMDSFLIKSSENSYPNNLSSKLSEIKCTQLFGLIFGSTFES